MTFLTGEQIPDVRYLTSEIPLTLQNSHYSVADSMPYLANVVNVACLHCKPAMQLSPDLDSFLRRGKVVFLPFNLYTYTYICLYVYTRGTFNDS